MLCLTFRADSDGNPCLAFGYAHLKVGDRLEVRLAERKWIPVFYAGWSGQQNDDPRFEIVLPGGNHRREIQLPVFADFRCPPD